MWGSGVEGRKEERKNEMRKRERIPRACWIAVDSASICSLVMGALK
jgi:hypothetical protein